MPKFPLIDAHLHIYDPARLSYPWMKRVPKLDRRYMPEDFFALSRGVEIEGAVFVEVDAAPDNHLEEARFVSEIARTEPLLVAAVVSVPLDQGASTAEELAVVSQMPLVRGVRQLLERHDSEPGWALRDEFVEGVQSLAAHNLTFDLCLHHPQLAEATELVRRCPDVHFVLDHIGKPGMRTGLSEPWRSDLRALAALPNVWCKISGVVTEADHAAWTEAAVAPYIAHAIACFGFERVMFGGDWPVSELATSYRRWVDLVDLVVAGASDAEKRCLYHDNATAFYRLVIR